MISVIETAAGKGNTPIYQLKVVLLGSEPPVWRRIQVPGDAKLAWLHAVHGSILDSACGSGGRFVSSCLNFASSN